MRNKSGGGQYKFLNSLFLTFNLNIYLYFQGEPKPLPCIEMSVCIDFSQKNLSVDLKPVLIKVEPSILMLFSDSLIVELI